MFTKRLFSWLGLLLFFGATFGNLALWIYFNKTQEVPYLKQAVNEGEQIQPDNIRFRSIRIQDLPEEPILTKEDLSSPKWRAVTGIHSTDPIIRSKVTDQSSLKIESNQIIMSFPFTNTGLLTFIEPGDKVSIIGPKVISNVLVLGKYDKNATKISLLPALTNDARKQAQGIIDQSVNQQQVQPAAALLLLVTFEQAQDIESIPEAKAMVALQSRDLLMSSKDSNSLKVQTQSVIQSQVPSNSTDPMTTINGGTNP